MIAAVIDHLWQSTLLASAIAILALALCKAPASVRYSLWLTASVKFLIPFATLAALGRLLAPEVRPPAEAAPGAIFVARAAAPLEPVAMAPHLAAPIDPVLVILGVWATGVAVVLILWMTRWAKIGPLMRRARPLAIKAPMPVLATSTMLEPGLVGIWRPVLLVPDALFAHLDRPGIDALVAHETCHFRRRDNLTAAIHMLVEALFWFHPMVWWIGARLVEERERACDEAVVRAGHDPAVYAESLLECCRLFLQSPLPCVAGASGSNLSRRVEMIMTSTSRSSLSRTGKAMLIAAGLFALASPVAAGWMSSPTTRQTAASAASVAWGPASAIADDTSTASSPPARPETKNATPAPHSYSAPAALLPPIAVTHPDPVKLDPVTSVTLSGAPSDMIGGGVRHLQLAQLDATGSDSGSAAQAAGPVPPSAPAAARRSSVADDPGQAVCINRNIAADSRIQTRICMSRNEWTRHQQDSGASDTAGAGDAFGDKSSPTDFSPGAVNAASEQATAAYLSSGAAAAAAPRGR